MPHNKNLEVPELTLSTDGKCTYTHNHANSYTFNYAAKTPTPQEKTDCHAFFKAGIKKVKACKSFMKVALEDKNLTGIQKATLFQHYKEDKELIKILENAKHSI